MYILSPEDQQKILSLYQKDYGNLVLEYNKCDKSSISLLSLKSRAELLCDEIQYNAGLGKNFFSEENSNFATEMVNDIEKFIINYLKIDNQKAYFFHTNLQNYAAA